jgi:L-asparaginase
MKKRKILVLYTGGTFGMNESLQIPNLSAKQLKARLTEQVPEMAKIADCDVEILFNIDSCQMNATHWFKLAERLTRAKSKYDGAVVLHGTDTLAYTGCALSFLLSPTPFPIVLTGAQRPLATLRSDARMNFISALEVAATAPKNLRDRVLVVFHDEVFLASRIRKKSALDFAAFESPRFPTLATIGSSIHYEAITKMLPKLSKKPTLKNLLKNIDFEFPTILPMEIAPNFPFASLDENLLQSLDGILLTLYTSGTAPTEDQSFRDFLERAKKTNTPIFAITEREAAPNDLSTYAAGKVLEDAGVLWCADLTPEAAYVRACLLRLSDQKSLRKEFLKQLKAEWTRPISDECGK